MKFANIVTLDNTDQQVASFFSGTTTEEELFTHLVQFDCDDCINYLTEWPFGEQDQAMAFGEYYLYSNAAHNTIGLTKLIKEVA